MDINSLFLKLGKRFAGQYTGQFRSIFRGVGVEIADSRKYVSGDARRFINWKQSAKHNDLYVSVLEQDRDMQVNVFCDVNYNRQGGSSVFAYLNDLVVFVRAQKMSLTMSYPDVDGLHTQHIGHGHEWLTLEDVLQHKVSTQTPVYRSSISMFLDRVVQEKKRRVLMIVSDFLDLDCHDVKRLQLLSQDYQLLLMRIPIDAWEGVNYIGGRVKKYEGLDHLFIDLV